jgi:multiple sugar transport system substrate-binding protein
VLFRSATAKPTDVPKPTATTTLAASPVKLTLWHAYSGDMGKQFEALITEFNQTHPNIQITPSYGGSLYTMHDKLMTAIAGKAAPDISQTDQYWASELGQANAIVKVANYLAKDPNFKKDDIYDMAWKTGSYKGEVWTMPFSCSNIVLYYNKDLFKAANLDPEKPPKNWAELQSMAKHLTKDTNGDGTTEQWGLAFPITSDVGGIYYWLAFLWQNNGQLFDGGNTKSLFNDQAGVDALQFWMDLMQKDKSVPAKAPDKGFETGLVAMTFASSSSLNANIKALGTDKLGMAPMPMGKKAATGVGGGNLAILSTCKAPDAAWEFVNWMTSAEINLRWSMQTGYLPLRKSVVASAAYQDYLKKEPRAQVIINQMDTAIVRPNVPAYAPGSREMGLAIEQAVLGKATAKAALDDAAKKVDDLLKQPQ